VLAESCGRGLVEEGGFLKSLKGIGVEDFGPDVVVVTRGIVPYEAVLEVAGAVAGDDLGDEADALHGGVLEGLDFRRFGGGEGVPVHIEIADGEVLKKASLYRLLNNCG